MLSGLLVQLGLPPAIDYPVRVAVEESRSGGETRADLVVRMPGVTLLIEAKVYADEQPGQCDRLADAWAIEKPELALTRAVGIIGQRLDTPEIVEFGSDRRYPMYGISLQIPGAESGTVWVALGWTRGQLLRPTGESLPYMGVKIPGATRARPGTTR